MFKFKFEVDIFLDVIETLEPSRQTGHLTPLTRSNGSICFDLIFNDSSYDFDIIKLTSFDAVL